MLKKANNQVKRMCCLNCDTVSCQTIQEEARFVKTQAGNVFAAV